jgi:pre-rRNA-processing protein TSR3
MNTAEAMAATLYIAGLKDDAAALLEPFAFGAEFLKINREALDAYAGCQSAAEVKQVEAQFAAAREAKGVLKAERQAAQGDDYLRGMDLPPSDDEGEEEEDDEEEEEEEVGEEGEAKASS